MNVLALSLALLLQSVVGCASGAEPALRDGFAALYPALLPYGNLGEVAQPTECEHAVPDGSGDTIQGTLVGNFYWRKATNTPTYFVLSTTSNSTTSIHLALTERGLVTWTDTQGWLDPPPDARLLPPRVAVELP